MERLPIVGYIVSAGDPREWFVWNDGVGSLVHGNDATLFHTRRQANIAVQKTTAFAIRNKFSWAKDFQKASKVFPVRCGEPSRWKRRKP